MERLAEEAINVGGAAVRIYVKQPNIGLADQAAQTWDEDADPVYSNPIDAKGYFKPQPAKQALTRWGVDAEIPVVITFSRATLLKKPGIGNRLLKAGDIIEIPYNHIEGFGSPTAMFVRINNATPTGNYHYRWIYIEATCENITGDEALVPKHR